MDIPKYTIKARKGQHLTAEERHDIEVHLKDGWSTSNPNTLSAKLLPPLIPNGMSAPAPNKTHVFFTKLFAPFTT